MSDQPTLRDRAIDAIARDLNAGRFWLPTEGRPVAADAVLALVAVELETSQRRSIRIQTLLDETRDRIRKLHRPVEHMGRVICAERSAYCGESTDNPPAPAPCPTITALNAAA
ncbi:hypothetical protein ADK52_25470 [Streptomyces sp. WM6372]|uniref:hypothetical protein n=1 Tax=Streptomyces sp. WM6372 TaxID=1415555 RepID=UPI0006AFD5E1|nr:hypothetical protein [Streptomyces sp. WM6372]KOU20942.1 hypothetical protein ADK52_25470 [Streptomyces sp. WM6372]